jgi:hypothetical protein
VNAPTRALVILVVTLTWVFPAFPAGPLAQGVARSATQTTPVADFFVAPNGNDSWTGKLAAPSSTKTDGPFASPARAMAAVHKLVGSRPNHPVTVMLREGHYYLALSTTTPGTLKFEEHDSGKANTPITWTNYPLEHPVISGGIPLGRNGANRVWKNVSGNLWQVDLPKEIKPFEYLFYNGERRLRARLQSPSAEC